MRILFVFSHFSSFFFTCNGVETFFSASVPGGGAAILTDRSSLKQKYFGLDCMIQPMGSNRLKGLSPLDGEHHRGEHHQGKKSDELPARKRYRLLLVGEVVASV